MARSHRAVGSGLAGSRPLEEGLQAGFDVKFDQFLNGQFTADTPDQPWSLHIDALLLQVAARRRARRQLMGRDEIRLLSGPSAAFKITLVVAAAAQQHMAVGRTTLALSGGGKVTFQRRQGLCVGEVIGTVPLAACVSLTCEGTGRRYSLRGDDGARTVLGPGGQVTRKDPPTSRAAAGEIVARWRGHLAVAAVGGSAITLYRTGPARTLRR